MTLPAHGIPVRRAPTGLVSIVVAALLLSAAAIAAPAAAPAARAVEESPSGRYSVLLAGAPLAAYRGGVADLAPTDPTVTGARRLDATSPASRAYLAHLEAGQAAALAAIEAALGRSVEPLFTYETVLNGFALEMSATEATTVASLAGVTAVVPDVELELLTDNGPAWIGAPSVWSGDASGVGTQGEGIVAGVIDTGINTDHPSFADVGGDGYDHDNPHATFHGLCDPVTGAPFCNDKLIGVWDFTGLGTGPEDDNGHGSHTAGTVAGNVLDAKLIGPTITVERRISGVAPHANIIAYKACFTTPVRGGCLQTGTVGSIDQAVRDGVDVINFSIGGASRDPWTDLNAMAFLNARRAGVFLAVSAGNSGPGAATVGSPSDSPWVTAVAASTHDRKFFNSLVGMSGGGSPAPADMRGLGVTRGLTTTPIVYAGDYGSALCGEGPANSGTGEALINPFPEGTFNGEIVVCDRGTYGRVEKAENVMEGGAGGYVLLNDEPSGDSLVADAYPIPGVHLTYNQGLELKAWLAQGDGHSAAISGMVTDVNDANGDVMASFSSRGHNPSVPGVIKPDVTAPGVDILAAFNTPVGSTEEAPEFNVISGTSMSGPHVAGAGALLAALHPDWSPDEIRSALMTTAHTDVLKEDAATPADPFDFGAGRVALANAARAGLVLDETADAYQAADPAADGDPSTLNTASLASDACDPSCGWTRTFTSVAAGDVTWTASVRAPSGMALTVSPSSFSLASGAEQSLEVTADTAAMANDGWQFAEVRLEPSDASVPAVHLPVAVLISSTVGVERTTLHFQGNADEGCTGDGRTDLVACGGPFLSTDDVLDAGDAASWTTTSLVNGTAARNIYDPNWVWNLDAPTTVGGPMTVRWWGACPACPPPVGAADWTIRLWADGVQVLAQRVSATPSAATGPSLLEATVSVPETTADSTFVLHVDPVYIDAQNPSIVYYDSSGPCTATVDGPCDSVVLMPVVGQAAAADLQITEMAADNLRARAGEQVVVSAVVTNAGDGDAAATRTELRLDDGTVLGTLDTPAIPAGASETVATTWDTRGRNGETVITATADLDEAVSESDEANNSAELTVTVRGNKVRNSSFEQTNEEGSGPDGWSGTSTDAGTTSHQEAGSHGERSVSITGTGGNVALDGLPSWTSEAIDVTEGEVLSLRAAVSVDGTSSAPSIGLAYLGPAGDLLQTVTVATAPLRSEGFEVLDEVVTVPAGVAQVRIVLAGFATTDLRTSGTVTFDEIGLFSE